MKSFSLFFLRSMHGTATHCMWSKMLDSSTGTVWICMNLSMALKSELTLCAGSLSIVKNLVSSLKDIGSGSFIYCGKFFGIHQLLNKMTISCIISFRWPYNFSDGLNYHLRHDGVWFDLIFIDMVQKMN